VNTAVEFPGAGAVAEFILLVHEVDSKPGPLKPKGPALTFDGMGYRVAIYLQPSYRKSKSSRTLYETSFPSLSKLNSILICPFIMPTELLSIDA
jgi:hypothetical protein